MKTTSILAVFAANIASLVLAKHGDSHLRALEHRHLHHQGRSLSAIERRNGYRVEEPAVEKRTGQCQFPEDAGLVPVSGSSNGGWAMSPDECCEPGGYCPYACPPGQVSMQWDPDATSYTYPQSMHGGLFCDKNGNIKKPFPDKPYCVDGTGNVGCHNKAPGNIAICQTVLPGNEAMLIPTDVQDTATLAIPGPEYWAGTAAHFYVNPPGVSPEQGCIWGSSEKPYGNWSPYVLGGNTVETGETFIKLGWNPIYLEPATPFRDEKPTFSIEIHGVNELVGSSSVGAGGAASCVVTVPKGGSARYVVVELDSKGSNNDKEDEKEDKPVETPKKSEPSPPPPQPKGTSPSSSPPEIKEVSTPTPTKSSSSSTSSTSTSTTTSSESLSQSSSSEISTPATTEYTSETSKTSTYLSPHTTFAPLHIMAHVPKPLKYSNKPHVFLDNSTATMTYASFSAAGSATRTASASLGNGTAMVSPPVSYQPQGTNGAGYTHVTAAAFSLTALAAFAMAAL
ncbi:MAG: hypothetical protein L6R36_001710 [Xanthoria steineri]|nr:MAG: hypothetical protein L6R36_001710 [Xanthoria steineri]